LPLPGRGPLGDAVQAPAMEKRARFIAQAWAATTVLAGSRAGAQSTPLSRPLRIAIAPSDGVTSVVYAKAAGMFERAGLDVQIDTQGNGAAVAAAIVSGTYDIGNSSLTSVLLAHEKGIPFTFVAPAGVYDARTPFTGALLLKDSTARLDKDAEHAIIGLVSLSGTGHDAFCGWVEQHGGDPSTIRFVEVPFSAAAAALETHRVVASETVTPAMTSALDTGNFRFLPVYSGIGPQFLISAWFTTKDFAGKYRETVRTFARVVAAAGTYANAHHAETAPIMSEFTKIPVDVMLRMPRALQGVTLSAGLITPVITAAARYGSLKRAFPAAEIIEGAA
jgi:NitT/TauT family transport system substrate-binding protein